MSDTDAEPRKVAGPAVLARLERLRVEHAGEAAYDDDLDEPAYDLASRRARVWDRTIPSRFLDARVEHVDGVARQCLDRWVTATPTPNLVVTGPVGVGKTHLAVAAARTRFDRGAEVQFWPAVELFDALRPGGTEGALRDLMDVDLLLLDDLGAERPSDWTGERLYALLNRRWLEQRPTIVTTNLPLRRIDQPGGSFEEAVGERTYSRVVGSGAVVVRLAGEDRRRRR